MTRRERGAPAMYTPATVGVVHMQAQAPMDLRTFWINLGWLVVLIATIGVGQLIIVLRLIIPKPSAGGDQDLLGGGANIFPLPFHFEPVEFGRVVLGPQHLLAVVIGICGIVALFRGQILWGIVLIILAFVVGPGGYSIFS